MFQLYLKYPEDLCHNVVIMRGIKRDYSSVDWLLPDKIIASQFGCSRDVITKARRRLGKPRASWRLPPLGSGRRPVLTLDHEFYNAKKSDGRYGPTRAWKRNAKRLYGEACEVCKYHKPPVSNHIHHRIPKSQGGKHTLRNAIVLCSRCHDEVHAGLLRLPERETLSLRTFRSPKTRTT